MKGALEVMKHMSDEDSEAKKKVDSIRKNLKEKEEELEDLEALNQTLIIQERKSNDELVEARKELIAVSLLPLFLMFIKLLILIYSFIPQIPNV